MTYEFKLPSIGEGLTEGEVTRWHVKEGDAVSENQPLCNVLTDKAEVEIPSPKAGRIVKLFAKPGEKVRVHAALVSIDLSGPTKAAQAQQPQAAPQAIAPAQRGQAPAPASGVSAAPRVRQLAKSLGVDTARLRGSGPEGRVLEVDVYAAAKAAPAKATPAVLRLAKELGVDLASVQATGPGGRIAEWDLRAAKSSEATLTISPPTQPSSGEARLPFVGIRRVIAERMRQSVSTAAHVTHMDECDMTHVLALREQLKSEAAKRNVKLTLLPFVIRALVKTLKEFAQFNASLDEANSEIVIKHFYNLGIAVNTGQGLIVPNIKGADGEDLWGLAAQVQALAERARAGKIDVPSLQGGTFTITNIGSIGGLLATPIVNYPEVAILGLMKLQKRPVCRNGEVVARDLLNLALSFDHRVIDGADAASFVSTLIKHLENPRTIL